MTRAQAIAAAKRKARAFDAIVARARGNHSRKIVVTERWLLGLIGKEPPAMKKDGAR